MVFPPSCAFACPDKTDVVTYIPNLRAPINTALNLRRSVPRPFDEDGLATVEAAVVWDVIPEVVLGRILAALEQESVQDGVRVLPALGLHHSCGPGRPPETGDGVPLIAPCLGALTGDLVVVSWEPGAWVVLVRCEGVVVLIGDKSCQSDKAMF